ncbi:hypothetical protein [Thalassobacillus sp. C254]|nr:hypothetical protein [Thalassobacillus sp. C254]
MDRNDWYEWQKKVIIEEYLDKLDQRSLEDAKYFLSGKTDSRENEKGK